MTPHGIEHALAHAVTVEQIIEALDDVGAIDADPDPRTKAGEAARRVGFSPSRGRVVTVIAVRVDGALYLATAFPTTGSDLREYVEANSKGDEEGDSDD